MEGNKSEKNTRGGFRPGSGRKKLEGARTTTIILTENLLAKFKKLGGSKWVRTQIRLAPDESSPPPSKDRFISSDISLDLNKMLIDPDEEVILATVPDNSMDRIGIVKGDFLLVKRGYFPKPGQIALMNIGDSVSLRRLLPHSKPEQFVAESFDHLNYPTIELPCPIVGTVSYVIKNVQ